MLKLFLLSTVMTAKTTKLTRLYKLFAQTSLGVGPLPFQVGNRPHLGHFLLVLSWVGLFVLLCYKKVMWICHVIKQIFHSSSKNRNDMALGVQPSAIYHFIFFSLSCSVVQYSTVQYSTVQYSTVQYSTVQYSTVQYSTVQYSTVQYSTVQYSTVQYSTVQYSTVQYSTVQYSTVQYSTVQYSTVQYSTVQYSTVQYSTVQYSTVQYSTVQYSTVQYSTVQYSTVQKYMIRETMIDAAYNLKLLNVLMKCIEEAIEEGSLFNGDDDNRVCLCDPTDIEAGYCCCNVQGKNCNGKCRPDRYDRWIDSQEPINR